MGYSETVIKYRWLVIVVSLLAVFASGAGMKFLAFENDDRVFFSPENPGLVALEEFEKTYNKETNIVYVVEPDSGDVFTRESLAAIDELTEASWRIPYSSRVDSITNYQHTWVDGDDMVVGDLAGEPRWLTPEDLLEVRRIALGEPLLLNRLVSPDGTMAVVSVTIIKPDEKDIVAEIDAYSDELVAGFRDSHPELKLYVTGGIPVDMAFSEVSQNDMMTLVPLMFAILVGGIYIFLRSVAGTVATVVVIASASIAAMGLAGWYGIRITSPTAMVPVIVLTLAVADSIHILTTISQKMARGAEKRAAIVESLRTNLTPVVLTSVTTAIGFLSMNSSDAPPFHDLGNMAATGVMAALLFSVTLLPALVAVLPMRVTQVGEGHAGLSERLGNFVVRRRTPLFVGTSLLVAFTAVGVTALELDDNFIEYFDQRYEIRTDTDHVTDRFMGIDVIELSLPAGSPDGINAPAYLEQVEKLAGHMRAEEDVVHVSAITDIVKKLNRTMHSDDPSYYSVPGERELTAQYLLLYELSLPFGLDLNDTINVDRSASRFRVTLRNVTSSRVRELEGEMMEWMKANTPGIYSRPTGLSVMFSHISERNINNMLKGSAAALVLISAILVVTLRSARMGLVSLIPNLFPAFMAFGVWGLVYSRVGLAVSVVSVISLGIVVDDTVHFLTRYLRARRELGLGPEDAVRYTFKTVGRAIITTSVVLMAGFSVLALSGFHVNMSMGIMTALAIVFALAADLFFLPPLLIHLDRRRCCVRRRAAQENPAAMASNI